MFRQAALSLLLVTTTTFAVPGISRAQSTADEEGVRRAVLDYVEGFYEGDTTRIIRGVRPEVTKYGFYTTDNGSDYLGEAMSFREMIAYANSVRERGRQRPASDPREIQLLDVLDQTAVAKLTAWWGTDYLQLAKYDGRWMIIHVLWQTAPPR